jgi:competence protein ComEC
VSNLDAIVATGQRGLWLPVFFGAGIALYFGFPVEPEFWPVALLFGLAGLLAVSMRRNRNELFFTIVAGAAMVAGFGAAQLRSEAVSGPVLEREIGTVRVSARVVRVEPTDKDIRLTLDKVGINRRNTTAAPERIRISVRSLKTDPLPGDRSSALTILQPPPSPSVPGGFDFARKAWFERFGAVGFALGAVTVTQRPEDTTWWLALARLAARYHQSHDVGDQRTDRPGRCRPDDRGAPCHTKGHAR